MFRNKQNTQTFLLVWGTIFFLFLMYYNVVILKSTEVRPRMERVEPFQSGKSIMEDYIEPIVNMEPDIARIDKPREPYNLLHDVLPASNQRVSPSSQRCYESDFQTRIEKTGNYRQLTNNYRRATPDSCSSPSHEYVLSFYKTDPLA
jgi:hypothetical protein